MRILMLTQFFYPEPGARVHELAAELVVRGHQVTVLTGFPTVPLASFYEGYRPSLFRRDQYQGVEVLRVPHFPHGQASSLRRMLHYGSFMVSAMTIGQMHLGPADVMYVLLPPPLLGAAAAFIGWRQGLPFMYDLQDIWPEAGVANGFLKRKWLIRSLKILAKWAYARARAINVPSAGYKRHLVADGVQAEKISLIPNWADEAVYAPRPYDHDFAAKYNLAGKFNITFAGNMSRSQALGTVIEAAACLAGEPQVQFVFAGDGSDLEALQAYARDLGLANVRFLGRLPKEAMPSLYAVSDALLVHLKKDPIFTQVVPSKTQAYLACGKPILMAVEGDGTELIQSTGAGLTCPSEDPEGLAQAVRRMAGLSPEARQALGQNGRQTFLERFTKQVVVDQFENLLVGLAKDGQGLGV